MSDYKSGDLRMKVGDAFIYVTSGYPWPEVDVVVTKLPDEDISTFRGYWRHPERGWNIHEGDIGLDVGRAAPHPEAERVWADFCAAQLKGEL